MKTKLFGMGSSLLAIVISVGSGTTLIGQSWKEKTISPVVNPVLFEDPHINSEVRPIFMHHEIGDDFITNGGDIQVYALQIRYAVTERLALIATKDGYIDFNPNAVLTDQTGWADIGFGLKYALIDDIANQFILTPGLRLELPTGNRDVFQGNGDGEWNLFVSSMKGWDNFHVTGHVGIRIPMDGDEESSSLNYAIQLDYWTCPYFIPFVSLNAFTILDEGKTLPLGVEGLDLINFGTTNADGRTQAVLGGGFRSRLCESADLGFAYEYGISNPQGLFDSRVTLDMIWRF